MQSIAPEIFRFHEEVSKGKYRWIKDKLDDEGIEILSEFRKNKNNIEAFYDKYVVPNNPKIVICGINPGRLGAGKTGVPFIDFTSLAKLIEGIDREDSEASAKFFYSIIDHFGKEKFYSNIYVTNISWLGFSTKSKPAKNVNYYNLPEDVKEVLFDNFIEEINLVEPTHILSCSNEVTNVLKKLKEQGKLKSSIDISIKLNHPYYCSIKTNTEREFKKYIDTLVNLI